MKSCIVRFRAFWRWFFIARPNDPCSFINEALCKISCKFLPEIGEYIEIGDDSSLEKKRRALEPHE